MNQEPIDMRHLVEALILKGQDQLKEVNLNFGTEFAYNLKKRIQTLSQDLQDSLTQDNQQRVEQYCTELENSLSNLNTIVFQYYDKESKQ